jgi:hypothetical protein
MKNANAMELVKRGSNVCKDFMRGRVLSTKILSKDLKHANKVLRQGLWVSYFLA